MKVLFIVSSDVSVAERLAQPLRDRGWAVEMATRDAEATCERIGECRPVALIVPLEISSDAECDLACALSVASNVKDTPVVFVGGSTQDRAVAASVRSDATFVTAHELPWIVKRFAMGN